MQTNDGRLITQKSSDSTSFPQVIDFNKIKLKEFLDIHVPNYRNVKNIKLTNIIVNNIICLKITYFTGEILLERFQIESESILKLMYKKLFKKGEFDNLFIFHKIMQYEKKNKNQREIADLLCLSQATISKTRDTIKNNICNLYDDINNRWNRYSYTEYEIISEISNTLNIKNNFVEKIISEYQDELDSKDNYNSTYDSY